MRYNGLLRVVALSLFVCAGLSMMAHMGAEDCGNHYESRYHNLVSLEAAKVAPLEAFTTCVS
jgi:hypothetical protein